MTENPKNTPPSFSTARRWKIGMDTVLRTALVLAVVVMANYIGSLFARQYFLSSQTRIHLSSRTVSILQTLTNRVDVTVYYDTKDGMYSTVMGLLNEYHRLDPRITVKVVDYIRDAGQALQVQQKYGLGTQPNSAGGGQISVPQKNVIIFDCAGSDPPRYKVAPGSALVEFAPKGMKDKQIDYRPVAFNGEKMFTSMLLAIANPKPFTAYFMQGDGEPSLTDSGDTGYAQFGATLQENYIRVIPFSLASTPDIPSDCDLLIIAGPQTLFPNSELGKIDHYLSSGGRLFVLLDWNSLNHPTGLENFLARYGVNVGMEAIEDPADAETGSPYNLVIQDFNTHPVVNSFMGSKLEMILPRPVGAISQQNAPADAPTVTMLAQSSPTSVIYGERGSAPRPYPLMAAVEQNTVKGITNPNGGMRMVVVGDSLFLNNYIIKGGANRDFPANAVNWLLARPDGMLNGIGPSPVTEFQLWMSPAQVRNLRWLLLGALPGVVIVLGFFVWLRRRN